MNKYRKQKFILSAALLIAATASAFAQGNGLAGNAVERVGKLLK